MFDISWTEFLLIGVVALIVIGPKELPAVMRTLGQWTRKVRSLAADFQNQFQEAMREAEMADLKKQVDDIAHDIKHYDPLKETRTEVEAIGKDFESSLVGGAAPANPAIEASATAGSVVAASAPSEPASECAAEDLVRKAVGKPDDAGAVSGGTGPATLEIVEESAEGGSTGRPR